MAKNKTFWVKLRVDGQEKDICIGPLKPDGGMYADFYIREKGELVPAFRVSCQPHGDKPYIAIWRADGEELYRLEVDR